MDRISESDAPRGNARRDWPLILGLATIGLTLLGLLPGYFIFWHRSDVVFDKRAVEIPLSGPLRKTIEDALAGAGRTFDSITASKNGVVQGKSPSQLPTAKLPDSLLYVNIRNVGKVPSSPIRVQISVPGLIADRDVSGAGPVLGEVTSQRNTDNGVYFECPNLADSPNAKLRVAIWYQKTDSYPPSVQIMETSEGPSREVGSVDTAGFYLFDFEDSLWFAVIISLFVNFAAVLIFRFFPKDRLGRILEWVTDRLIAK